MKFASTIAISILFAFTTQHTFAQNVGIGEINPGSRFTVKGNLGVGTDYSTLPAPTNGLIIEGRVGLGTSSPDTNAMLDMESTAKGILIPRISSTSRIGIAAPSTGLLVFDSNMDAFYYYNGSSWIQLGAQGPTGPTGAAGTNGSNGATGPTGAAGVNGTDGTNGTNGSNGATGPTGAAGSNGATGATGLLSAGATGSVPYYNGSLWVVNGTNIYDNGGNIGIGNSSPGSTLDVTGNINSSTGYKYNGSIGTAGQYLRSDGVNGFIAGTIQASDLPGSISGFANPTGTIGLTAVNGSATTAMRSDAAPALSQAIIPTWTGTHTFSNATYSALFTGGNVGIGTSTPSNALSFGGNSANTIWMERNTTANTAGNNLTVQSGGAISGATNKAGGDLYLSSGTATGTGASNVHILVSVPAATSGTSDNAPSELVSILGQGTVGIGNTSPDTSSAILDIKSTTKGILPPRMSTTQRNQINVSNVSASQGLTIFNTTTNCLEAFIGTSWQPIGCGCSSAPSMPSAFLTSTSPVCQEGSGYGFSITEIAGASSYVWTLPSGASIANGSGTSSITVNFASTAASGTQSISIAASNSCGTSPALSENITVNQIPVITGSPSNSTICALGGSYTGDASFSVTATGTSLTYQWQVNTGSGFNNITNGGVYSNATTSTLNITGATTSYNGYQYQCVVSGACSPSATSSTATLTVNPLPTANAGSALSAICQSGTTVALGGSFGGGATAAVWSDGGVGGTFANNTGSTPNTATYTASASSSSSVTLTLTTSGGSCGTATASKSLTVNPNPTAYAGSALSAICQSGATVALGGSFGGGATAAVWSDGGAGGSFANNGGSTPGTTTYTASSSSSTPVTLTLTTSGGSCGTTTASKNLTVNPNPTANAGSALSAICQSGTTAALGGSFGGGATSAIWSDGGAGGSFTNNGGSTPNTTTYTASASSASSVTLTLTTSGGSCSTTTASKSLTVNPNPTANAGSGVSAICQSGTTAALGGSFGGGATAAVWSDGGAGGSFTNNGGSTPGTTTYTASSSSSTPVTLTLTTSGGSCGTTTASKSLTVNPNPTANAGSALSAICQSGTTAALGGSFGGGATSAVWSDGGAGGSFSNNGGSTPNTATYTASSSESSPVTLTLTTSGGSCGTTTASKSLTVNVNPTANAGSALSAICQSGTTAALGGSFGGGATSAVWSDGGAGGSFANNGGSTPNTATYTASASSASSVTLTLTTSGGSCGQTTASKSLTVNPNPTANVGSALSAMCQGGTTVALGGSFGGGATSAVWSDGGKGGTFTNNSGSTPGTSTYTSSSSSTTPVTLTLTTSGGSCGTTTASKSLTVNPNPIVTATPTPSSGAVCSGTPVNITLSSSISGTTYTWSVAQASGISGGNTCSSSCSTTITDVISTSSHATSATATYTITGTAPSTGCSATTTSVVTVNPIPTITATPPSPSVCSGNAPSIALTSSVTSATTTYAWSVAQASGITGGSSSTGTPIAQALSNSNSTSATATYTITGTSSSCTATASAVVTVNPLPSVTLAAGTSAFCLGSSTSLTATPSGGSGTYSSYAWTGSGLANATTTVVGNTATPTASGSQSYTVAVTDNNTCQSSAGSTSVTVYTLPTITASSSATSVGYSTSSQNSSLSYSATTGTPTHYTITWSSAGLSAGLVNVGSTSLPASPITVPVAASASPGTYTGTLTVTNANGCASTGSSFTLTINSVSLDVTSGWVQGVSNGTHSQTSATITTSVANEMIIIVCIGGGNGYTFSGGPDYVQVDGNAATLFSGPGDNNEAMGGLCGGPAGSEIFFYYYVAATYGSGNPHSVTTRADGVAPNNNDCAVFAAAFIKSSGATFSSSDLNVGTTVYDNVGTTSSGSPATVTTGTSVPAGSYLVAVAWNQNTQTSGGSNTFTWTNVSQTPFGGTSAAINLGSQAWGMAQGTEQIEGAIAGAVTSSSGSQTVTEYYSNNGQCANLITVFWISQSP